MRGLPEANREQPDQEDHNSVTDNGGGFKFDEFTCGVCHKRQPSSREHYHEGTHPIGVCKPCWAQMRATLREIECRAKESR